MEKGKRVKVQYKDLNASLNELELESIEVIENYRWEYFWKNYKYYRHILKNIVKWYA